MLEYLFLVERQDKLEAIKGVAGDRVELLVVDEWPASSSIHLQGQNDPSVFSFQPIDSVWGPVFERIAGYTDIYYCFDTSMDGEYLSYLVDQLLQTASGGKKQGHRLHLAGVADDMITQSLSRVEPINERACLRYQQHTLFHKVFFSHLNRLLGTTQGPGGIDLSISTLTMLSLVAEQHSAGQQMSSPTKWELGVRVVHGDQNISGRLVQVHGGAPGGFCESREQVRDVAETVEGQTFVLVDQVEAELVFPAPSLYTLPELVVDAYRFYQIAPSKVVAGLQELFAAGLVSSPHGVSAQNMQPVFERLVGYVKAEYGEGVHSSNEVADGVILPLDPTVHPDTVRLPVLVQQLYQLVWARAVASQMVDGVGDEQTYLFELEGKQVSVSSLTVSTQGFLAVFNYGFDTASADDTPLSFQKGDTVLVDAVLPQQARTQGKSPYHFAALCAEMREMGFDDVKLLLSVFQQLLDQNYVILRADGEIHTTDTLLKVTSIVDRAFPGMKGLNLTAYFAQTLEEVMSGRKRVEVALKQFDQNLVMQGKSLLKTKVETPLPKIKRKSKHVIKGGGSGVQVKSSTPPVPDRTALPGSQQEEGETVVPVPEPVESLEEDETPQQLVEEVAVDVDDGSDAEQHSVKDGPEVESDVEEPVADLGREEPVVVEEVFAQPSHSAQESAVSAVEVDSAAVVEPVDLATLEVRDCPECGRDMVVKDDRFGQFWACTGAPSCHHSETYSKKEKVKKGQQCPVCQRGELSVNRTPAGKDMYTCTDPVCDFMAWAKPHSIACPLCGSSFLVEKKDATGNVHLRCPMAGCNYVHGGGADTEPAAPKKKMVRVRRKKSGSTGGTKKRVVRRVKK